MNRWATINRLLSGRPYSGESHGNIASLSQETFLNSERARLYAAIVSEPKQLKIYDAPHALNAEARRDRIAFLTEQLRLKPLPAALVSGIPNLYQPPAY